MPVDFYAPPTTPVAAPETPAPPFYVVGLRKFWLLYAATFGYYQLYWHYAHWAAQKRWRGDRTWPWLCALLAPLSAYVLFRRIALGAGKPPGLWPAGLAAAYVTFLLLWQLRGPLPAGPSWLWNVMLAAGFVLLFCPGVPLALAQAAANAAAGDPSGAGNARLTFWNYVVLVAGVFAWVLVLQTLAAMFGYPTLTAQLSRWFAT